MNQFIKSHGLGNEYVVLDSRAISFNLTVAAIQKICNVHYGIGSDGILLKVPSHIADFGLQIFNPDGSEAEKSGNGLRIFCKYLYDYKFTTYTKFSVETKGGLIQAEIIETKINKARIIKIEMGKAIFSCSKIPVKFDLDECINESLDIEGTTFKINCVSVGNPHCVIIKERLDKKEIMHFGPLIEKSALFPNRINVQFAKLISRTEAEVLIWERSVGFTNASGSSSCAVACVLKKRGLSNGNITIKMPGGELKVGVDDNWNIEMTGEVQQIAEGNLSDEFIEQLSKTFTK